MYRRYDQHAMIKALEFIADEIEDLKDLPEEAAMGSTCYIIADASTYMKNSRGEWIPQNSGNSGSGSGGSSDVDLSKYATIDFVNKQLANKQDAFVDGVSIKTLNGISLLGSGNINLDDQFATDEEVSQTVINVEETITEALTIEKI